MGIVLTTVQTILDNAIDLADMRNSAFIDVSGTAGTEGIRYANLAWRDLYQKVILSREFYFSTTATITILAGTDSYSLPTDFYKLDGVDLQIDATTDRYLTLSPAMFKERNKYRFGLPLTVAPFGMISKYILIGDKIKFIPKPTQSSVIQLWYTPSPATLTTLADTISCPPGGDEYMTLFIASAMREKEESDTTRLDAKRQEVLQQLNISLKDRDSGSPHKVIDSSSINTNALYPFSRF